MKKLFIRILLSLLPPIFFIGFVSYYADPGEIFHDRSLQITHILQAQQNAALRLIPANWSNIHIEMVKGFKRQQKTPHTVLWGSSRSAEINHDFVHHQSFFNHVLPGANLMDFIAMLGLYEQENKLPETLILTIDPMLFYPNKANGAFFVQDTDKSHILRPRKGLEAYCRTGLSFLDTTLVLQKKFPIFEFSQTLSYKVKSLFMPDYFQTSLRSLGKTPIIALNEETKDGYFILRKDGGYSIGNTAWINGTQVAARADAFFKATNGIYFCDECIKNTYFDLFKTLLIHLSQQEKREVVLFFAPIHPIAYQQFAQKEDMLLEKACKRFADSLQIAYMGSYDPFSLGLDKKKEAFIDEIHLSKEAMAELLKR